MALARITNWSSGQILTAAALNGEFNNVLSYINASLPVVATYTKASLPTAGNTGQLVRVSDNARGIWMDNGTQYFATNGQVINVQEFGAKGDGSTDDSVALQAAITAGITYSLPVYIPPVTTFYKFTTTLTITGATATGFRMFGAGPHSKLTYTTNSGNGIEVGDGSTGFSNCRLDNFMLTDNNYTNSSAGWGIKWNKSPRGRMTQMTVDWGSTGSGAIYMIGDSHSCSIDKSWISGIAGTGIKIVATANGFSIANSVIEGQSTSAGVMVSVSAVQFSMKGTVLETGLVGVDLLAGSSYHINGYFENFATNHIRGTDSSSIQGVVIEGCRFIGATNVPSVGVDLSPTGGSSITGVNMPGNSFSANLNTAHIRYNSSVGGVIGPNINSAGSITFSGTAGATLNIIDADTGITVGNSLFNVNTLGVVTPSNIFVGDTSNAFLTKGATLNQGAADDEIITLKSSDVAHALTSETEADSYGTLAKIQAASGGLRIVGYDDGGTAAKIALMLTGFHTSAADTTKSTAGRGLVEIQAGVNSAGSATTVGADGNMLAVRNSGTTRFILDADGDSHQDVGTAWTNFDDYEDAVLLKDLSFALTRSDDPIKESFGGWLKYNQDALVRAKLVNFGEDGRPFLNMSKLQMLLTGAVIQLSSRCQELETKLKALEA